jgi:hypothetical protein
MGIDRKGAAGLAGVALLLAGGGTALAGKNDGDKAARCQARIAKIAERRGISVEQLQADVQARLLARVDRALAAGRISDERAASLRERIDDLQLCSDAGRRALRHGARHVLLATADYLGLTPAELRAQLHGTSLAALAVKQGKTVDGLEAAMLAPAEERLAKAVTAGTISQEQADARLARLERLVDRLVHRTFSEKH